MPNFLSKLVIMLAGFVEKPEKSGEVAHSDWR
jgi:hypothetical protein